MYKRQLESYIVEGFGNGMYKGMMLDCLKGRSVSRPASSNQAAGREAMMIILQIVDSVSYTHLDVYKRQMGRRMEYYNTDLCLYKPYHYVRSIGKMAD